MTRTKGEPVPNPPPVPAIDDGSSQTLAWCQLAYRVTTAAILGAFVLLVIVTTVSTAPWVQWVGKFLYYAIVAGAALSAAVWYIRSRLEKTHRRAGH
jgi:hypothetical protein